MIVLNFSHPITPEQRADIERVFGNAVEIREVMVQYDMTKPLAAQATAFFDSICERRELSVAIRFPAMAGELMLAVAMGRLGYMPLQIVIRSERTTFGQTFVFSHIESLEGVRKISGT